MVSLFCLVWFFGLLFMIGYTTRIISIDALRIDAVGRQRSAGFGQGWYGKIWEDGEVDVDVA